MDILLFAAVISVIGGCGLVFINQNLKRRLKLLERVIKEQEKRIDILKLSNEGAHHKPVKRKK